MGSVGFEQIQMYLGCVCSKVWLGTLADDSVRKQVASHYIYKEYNSKMLFLYRLIDMRLEFIPQKNYGKEIKYFWLRCGHECTKIFTFISVCVFI